MRLKQLRVDPDQQPRWTSDIGFHGGSHVRNNSTSVHLYNSEVIIFSARINTVVVYSIIE